MALLIPTDETAPLTGQPGKALSLTLLIGLAAAVTAMPLFAWLARDVLKGETLEFDAVIRVVIHNHASPVLTSLMRAVTMLGSPVVLIAMGFCAVVLLLRAGRRRAAVLLIITFLGVPLLDVVLKLSFRRARPAPFFDTLLPSSYSFPSGHALWSCCFYGVLAAIIAARTQSYLVRVLVWAVAALLILLVGLSRIYLGVHYPSDVLAGYAAASIWVGAVALGDHLLRRRG